MKPVKENKKRGGPPLSISRPKQLASVAPADLASAGANNGAQGRVRPAPAQLDEFVAWLVDADGRIRFGQPNHGGAGGAGNNFRFNFPNLKGAGSYYILVLRATDRAGRTSRNTRQIIVT